MAEKETEGARTLVHVNAADPIPYPAWELPHSNWSLPCLPFTTIGLTLLGPVASLLSCSWLLQCVQNGCQLRTVHTAKNSVFLFCYCKSILAPAQSWIGLDHKSLSSLQHPTNPKAIFLNVVAVISTGFQHFFLFF